MAAVVSHAMRRYSPSPPGSSFSSHCLGGESSYPEPWPQGEISESSLSRSMRYAEPWLYGSMRAPGGFLLAPALVLCSCSEYLSGTKRSSKKGPSICKKCKGTRLPLPASETLRGTPKFGTVRCYPTGTNIAPPSSTNRAGTARVSTHTRPSILPSADPYELMRRSRLSADNGTKFTIRSSSPSPAPSSKTTQVPKVPTTNGGRKSILECNINPYDLMSADRDSAKDSSITLVGGQRVRIRPPDVEQEYEEIKVQQQPVRQPSQIPKLKTPPSSSNTSKGQTKLKEKESDCNRFKSILKKPTTFSDTDSSGGPERSPSPASKSGSHFYLPMPMNTPRKKVQFLVENEFASQNDDSAKDGVCDEVNIYEEVPHHEEVPVEFESRTNVLRRSVSEHFLQQPTIAVFHDTTALRPKSSRADTRSYFETITDFRKLDGIAPSVSEPLKTLPKTPTVPQEAELDKQSDNTSDEEAVVEPEPPADTKLEEPVEEVVLEPETPPREAEPKVDIQPSSPPTAPPRKRSSSKLPLSTTVDISPPKVKTEPDYTNKTVVQIRAPSAVHKIQIKNEFLDNNIQTVVISDNAQRKTSIMINGDDCYSTINVNDNVPTYQSSVVVKDMGAEQDTKLHRSSSVYITGNFVSPEPKVPTNGKTFAEFRDEASELPTKEHFIIRTKPSSEDLKELLKDPVEAVKRNLVPHVCGKSDVLRRPSDRKLSNFTSNLLEDFDGKNMDNLIHDSLVKLKNYESDDDKDTYSDRNSSTPYELIDPGSDCYTDNSNRSSLTEEELNARTKFYEMLADSAIAEISEGEDHHYESIRQHSDPIYEEINPPPLPSNPPPTSIIDDLQLDKHFTTRSIFEGASKYDILSYLVDAKERGIVPEDSYNFGNSDVVIEEDGKDVSEQYRVSHISTVSDSSEDSSLVVTNSELPFQKSAEVERNDSGVGSETSKSSLSRYRTKSEPSLTCEDCEIPVESPTENEPLLCRKCLKKRSERKEIITEIVETEEKYSRDLQIILEEFYQPMLVAGLLTPDQLSAIFLNVEELLENSQALAERLRDAVEIATEQGDEDLLTVNIGKLFLEAAPMLHGFETYCIRQGNASLLLASLEKEKELLRIFLRVSQMENTMLRRMNLNSFLMVPVQRVTKYPLLLSRLCKATPGHHENRDQLKEAQHKIELHLSHMNSETKDVPSKLWRRIGSGSGRRASSEMDLVSIKLRKIAVDVLEWNHEEAKFALEGKLLFTQPTDNNWRKGRTIKLAPINALLVTNGKQMMGNKVEEDGLTFPKNGIREAALLLVRDKNGRYSLLREPLYLDRCIIATDPAWNSYFEVQEVIGKDTFIFKAEDDGLTRQWYRQLQFHAQGLGGWRKRRNALANIMINGMGLRS
ncbi:hypothetical protein PPYR_10137 [Photinus pyralis]|uniref:DH domain-containing protein n=1 Tax=Photinus pyralis TaxID=7054 RepID=A0A5N4AFK7_PHOPY|nr:uncharacterized protein LOC116174856 [Photinus pyralis]KAB0796076.1 hypothetical protein PPYR_10137 [Photinus pyralis]